MYKELAAGLLSCAASAAWAAGNAPPPPMEELAAFLESVQQGELRSPRRYAAPLPDVSSRNGKRTVTPALDIVAGRLDSESCLYQFRLELRWSGPALDDEDAEVGGRSLIQKAPCATLVQEVVAVASYEMSALRRRLQEGGRFAINQEREQVIAAARKMPLPDARPSAQFAAVTIDSRVNLRVSPSLKAPVLSKLAPASMVQVTRTASADWYQLRGQPGYLHASALQSLHPADALAPEPLIERVAAVDRRVGTAHVPLRDSPSLSGRVVGRLKPGAKLRLIPSDEADWFELEDGSGFVPAAGLEPMPAAEPLVNAAVGRQAYSAP